MPIVVAAAAAAATVFVLREAARKPIDAAPPGLQLAPIARPAPLGCL